jgi:hypothetical protein
VRVWGILLYGGAGCCPLFRHWAGLFVPRHTECLNKISRSVPTKYPRAVSVLGLVKVQGVAKRFAIGRFTCTIFLLKVE